MPEFAFFPDGGREFREFLCYSKVNSPICFKKRFFACVILASLTHLLLFQTGFQTRAEEPWSSSVQRTVVENKLPSTYCVRNKTLRCPGVDTSLALNFAGPAEPIAWFCQKKLKVSFVSNIAHKTF